MNASKRKHGVRRASMAGALALGMVVLGVAPAMAASHAVEGTLSCIGALSTYSTFRPHSTGGASLKVSSFKSISSGGVNYGLRNTGGTQISQSLNFTSGSLGSTKSFKRSSNGSTSIPGGQLALNARHITTNTGCGVVLPSWKGTLNQ